ANPRAHRVSDDVRARDAKVIDERAHVGSHGGDGVVLRPVELARLAVTAVIERDCTVAGAPQCRDPAGKDPVDYLSRAKAVHEHYRIALAFVEIIDRDRPMREARHVIEMACGQPAGAKAALAASRARRALRRRTAKVARSAVRLRLAQKPSRFAAAHMRASARSMIELVIAIALRPRSLRIARVLPPLATASRPKAARSLGSCASCTASNAARPPAFASILPTSPATSTSAAGFSQRSSRRNRAPIRSDLPAALTTERPARAGAASPKLAKVPAVTARPPSESPSTSRFGSSPRAKRQPSRAASRTSPITSTPPAAVPARA